MAGTIVRLNSNSIATFVAAIAATAAVATTTASATGNAAKIAAEAGAEGAGVVASAVGGLALSVELGWEAIQADSEFQNNMEQLAKQARALAVPDEITITEKPDDQGLYGPFYRYPQADELDLVMSTGIVGGKRAYGGPIPTVKAYVKPYFGGGWYEFYTLVKPSDPGDFTGTALWYYPSPGVMLNPLNDDYALIPVIVTKISGLKWP